MANDPNRDLLPVKDIDDRSIRAGINCRVDHNIVGKLKRCDLEDRYMRLYDENTQFKKQLNCQDEKIKRLGTKLLRMIGEKKNCPDSCRRRQDGKGFDELQMRIIELEHENYTLKDRNVVLKQQLANHARHHVAAHRSPNRSVHTSPRISQRQSSAPNVNDSNYILSNRNNSHDIQLREAEEHISGLNEEIKSLHSKIDTLQQDLEKSCLENQKTKVCENIELIRLQRSLKQQSIQIATLQAQIKNAEKCQKLLRDELAAAHKENEESLQIISDKQNEILDLYTKLEEKNLNRLEREEMKERINDLTSERDSLRERGEFLMKTIESKSSETEIINDLKKLLASEKTKKEELKQSLENTQRVLQALKESARLSQSSDEVLAKTCSTEDTTKINKKQATVETQTTPDPSLTIMNNKSQENELELLTLTQLVYSDEKNYQGMPVKEAKVLTILTNNENRKWLSTKSVGTSTENFTACRCSKIETKEAATHTEQRDFSPSYNEFEQFADRLSSQRACEAEKINLERELDYVKQMLRSQTQRCEAQEEEISRIKSDLHVSEEKYNDTLKRLDLHLKIFRHLESRTSKGFGESDSDTFERKYLSLLASFDEGSLEGPRENNSQSSRMAEEGDENSRGGGNTKKKNVKNVAAASESSNTDKPESSHTENDGRLRFMQRKFLVSSDEDDDDVRFEKEKDFVWDASAKISPVKDAANESSKRQSLTRRSPKKSESLGSDSSDSTNQLGPFILKVRNQEDVRPVPKPRTELSKTSGEISGGKVLEVRSPMPTQKSLLGTTISICIEWLKLETDTSVWYNDNVKLLFIDFSFLDVKGEETETPSSLKKPKKPVEKCHYNFTKSIEITEYRATALQALRNRPDQEVIVFKIVSEPEESGEDSECIDIGVAVVTIKQFFESKPNNSVLLQVKNIIDMKEIIGILSIRLDVSAIM